MKTNEILRATVINVVENQIRANDPPQTKQTYDRLLKLGISATDAKKHIGQCVVIELFQIMQHKEPFNKKRYINNLNKLPEEPFDD